MIRNAFFAALGDLSQFPYNSQLRTGANYQFQVVQANGLAAKGWTVLVQAVLLGVTVSAGPPGVTEQDVVWSTQFTLDANGMATGQLPIGLDVTQTYQFTVVAYDLGNSERGAITWNESGLYAFSSGVQAEINLSTGKNSGSTGGASQGSGTGSSQTQYVDVTFTLLVGGNPVVGAPVSGYLAGNPNGSWIALAGSSFNGKTDANGQISAQLTTGLDPTVDYRYDIAFPLSALGENTGQDLTIEFYFSYDGSSLAEAAGPATTALSIQYSFSGKTGAAAVITSNAHGIFHNGPAVTSGSPG